MQLDAMYVNPKTQDLYAKIIAMEDILIEYNIDLINPQTQGETNELY